jgi:hypothetical protein
MVTSTTAMHKIQTRLSVRSTITGDAPAGQ